MGFEWMRWWRCSAWLFLCWACGAQAQGFAWPEGRKAAVSLAYDDGLPSQLEHAVPALERHGLKATFYLSPGQNPQPQQIQTWRALARSGHELGNHTLFHPCSGSREGREWVEPHRDLDAMTIAQMQDQVRMANLFLHALDGREERSFTAPCGDRFARDGDYVDALRETFVGIKVVDGARIASDMSGFDRHAVLIEAQVEESGEELIARVEQAARNGTLAAFTFHGIGGDYLAVSSEAHEQLLDYLARHRETYWTATFLDIARWVRDHEGSHESADKEISE